MSTAVINNYVLGDGEVFLDPHDTSGNQTGEVNIGNVPQFVITSKYTTQDIFAPEGEVMALSDTINQKREYISRLSCENLNGTVLSYYLRASLIDQTDPAETNNLTIYTVMHGRWYQIGQDTNAPTGVRNVTGVVVRTVTTVWVEDTDYILDANYGRIFIPYTSNIPNNSVIEIEFDTVERNYERVQADSNEVLWCSIRFLAANRSGIKRDMYAPRARLTPIDNLDLISSNNLASANFDVSLAPVNGVWFYLDDSPVGV